MLTFDYLDTLAYVILPLYYEYERRVINSIVRRLANVELSSAATWQLQRLIESGAVYEDVLSELSRLTGKSEKTLRQIFSKAGIKATQFDDSIYRAAGLSPKPLNMSPAMADILNIGFQKTNGLLTNLTATTAFSAQNSFIDALDRAYFEVSTGAFDYNTAIKNAVIDVADKGLRVIQYAGRDERLDVAVRRAVLTGVNQTAGMLTEARADEMGTDLVQTSAHIGARNQGDVPENHEMWQGRVFSRTGVDYPNFYEITGYGTGEGIYGWNCRHSHYVFFKGISEAAYQEAELESYADKTVTYNGKEMSWYEATQQQRSIERHIRSWKRKAAGLEAAGLDNIAELAKVKQWQGRMRDFVKQTGIYRQSERERVYE